MTYGQFKEWYEAAREEIPLMLDCGFVYYSNVKQSIERNVYVIDTAIDRYGVKQAREMRHVSAAANSLVNVVLRVEYLGEWNVKERRVRRFSNPMKSEGVEIKLKIKRIGAEERHFNALSNENIHVDFERCCVTFPVGVTASRETKKSLKYFKDRGFISIRVTF